MSRLRVFPGLAAPVGNMAMKENRRRIPKNENTPMVTHFSSPPAEDMHEWESDQGKNLNKVDQARDNNTLKCTANAL